MNYLDAGVRLLILSGIVRCAKYISAAIYMSGSASQSRELFVSGLGYVGMELDFVSAAAVTLGVLFLAMEIVLKIRDEKGKKGENENEKNNN